MPEAGRITRIAGHDQRLDDEIEQAADRSIRRARVNAFCDRGAWQRSWQQQTITASRSRLSREGGWAAITAREDA